jgi:hypothetical protein
MKPVFGTRIKIRTSRVIVCSLYAAIAIWFIALALFVPATTGSVIAPDTWVDEYVAGSRVVSATISLILLVLCLSWQTKAEAAILRLGVGVLAASFLVDLSTLIQAAVNTGSFYPLLNASDVLVILVIFVYRIFLIDRYLLEGSRSAQR